MTADYDPRNPNWENGIPAPVGKKSSLMILREQTAQIASHVSSINTRLVQLESRISAGNSFEADQKLIQHQVQIIERLKERIRELRDDRGSEILGDDGRPEGAGASATMLLAGLPEAREKRDQGGRHRGKRSGFLRAWLRSTS